jgi:hypothetical protein
MTVAELKNLLEHYDDNQKVMFAYNAGDYWKTIVAEEVTELDELEVSYSAYHQKYKLTDGDDEEDEYEYETALILQ